MRPIPDRDGGVFLLKLYADSGYQGPQALQRILQTVRPREIPRAPQDSAERAPPDIGPSVILFGSSVPLRLTNCFRMLCGGLAYHHLFADLRGLAHLRLFTVGVQLDRPLFE